MALHLSPNKSRVPVNGWERNDAAATDALGWSKPTLIRLWRSDS